MRRSAAFAVLAMLLPGGTRAAPPGEPPLPPVQDTRPADAPAQGASDLPPYEHELERLAERLGTLALLRNLCQEGDAATWRDRMTALIEAEAKSGPRRDRLVAAYNRGFRGYAASYHACTPSARLVIARSLAETERLTREIQARYSGT